MDKYLTSKANPGRMILLAENAAALLLAVLLFGWGFIAVFGFLQDGFLPVVHVSMVLVAIPFILLLSRLLERKRARIHAKAIAGALNLATGESIPLEELEKITGVRNVAKAIPALTAKGLLRDVLVMGDHVHQRDRAECTYCGARLSFCGEGPNKCPSCGSTQIKY